MSIDRDSPASRRTADKTMICQKSLIALSLSLSSVLVGCLSVGLSAPGSREEFTISGQEPPGLPLFSPPFLCLFTCNDEKKEQFSLNISRHTHTAKVVREPRKKKERNKTFATFALHFSVPVPRMPE
jgi:hypothetical protein